MLGQPVTRFTPTATGADVSFTDFLLFLCFFIHAAHLSWALIKTQLQQDAAGELWLYDCKTFEPDCKQRLSVVLMYLFIIQRVYAPVSLCWLLLRMCRWGRVHKNTERDLSTCPEGCTHVHWCRRIFTRTTVLQFFKEQMFSQEIFCHVLAG